jgi:hypothetical protein
MTERLLARNVDVVIAKAAGIWDAGQSVTRSALLELNVWPRACVVQGQRAIAGRCVHIAVALPQQLWRRVYRRSLTAEYNLYASGSTPAFTPSG